MKEKFGCKFIYVVHCFE